MEEPQIQCMICLSNRSKYTCPICAFKTCSLSCYKTHQTKQTCTGKVDVTRFVKQEELTSNPVHLNRDYSFLQTVDRQVHLSKEDIKVSAKNIFKRSRNDHFQNRKRFKSFYENGLDKDKRKLSVCKTFLHDPPTQIKRDNTLVVQLPSGMSRSVSNKTGYEKRLNCFVWTVEWILFDGQAKEVTRFLSFRLKENLTLKEIVPINILSSHGISNKDSLRFYLKNVINQPKDSVLALDSNSTLNSALKNKVVLEYPTIYITQEEGDVLKDRVVDEKKAYTYGLSDAGEEDSSESEDSLSNKDDDDDSDSGPEEHTSKNLVVSKFSLPIDIASTSPIASNTEAASDIPSVGETVDVHDVD
ncbi:hypothetical protein KGF56_003776 [Candida oxycetoniae]|uniref:HIT-type domain-containing protein n=1 Tax=Candida oxycetoniae TaxID=497107 RepID=A0AAI9SV57_9ASCO|nr:uncharacterized protein KGF56_003776 [Candida oxycetoniae]KAI3403492.2 hypothetical protein KGF56_003776 [Candida oxycetoniae]